MWWMLSVPEPESGAAQPLPGDGSGRSYLTLAERLRLWHGRVAPGAEVRRVTVPGCDLVTVGCCTARDVELEKTAVQLARGDVSAASRIDGSRVVIAVRPCDVLIAGDLAGQRPIFMASTNDGLLVGSHARALAMAGADNGRLDWSWLAAHLLIPDAADVWWTGTPWRGVTALRPGWMLRIDRAGKINQFPCERLPAPESSLSDGGVALCGALHRAVAGRVHGAVNPTTDLSGGLDSSTVAVLAANALGGLPALTVATDGVEDVSPAARLASEVPALRHEAIREPIGLLPYSDLDQVPATDEPWIGAATSARERWWLHQVADRRSDLHLSGDGGDGVLIATPAYLADLVPPTRVRALWRHVVGWARLRHQSPRALLQAAIALHRTSYATARRNAARRLLGEPAEPVGWARLVSWFGISPAAGWATADARAAVARSLLRDVEEHPTPVVPGQMGTGDASSLLGINTFARQQRLDMQFAGSLGVNHHAPYLDNGVIRACWSVPAWQRTTPEEAKPLLAHAVNGIVPSRVVGRKTKGDYTAQAYRGLRANADSLRDLCTDSRLAEAGLLDVRKVLRELERGISGQPIRLAALDAVIGAELWLRANAHVETHERLRHADRV